jgi:hypothetical protein
MASRKTVMIAIASILAGGGLILAFSGARETSSSGDNSSTGEVGDEIEARASRVHAMVPTASEDEVQRLMDESDAIKKVVNNREPRTQTRYLLHALERLAIPEEEARAYHAAHPEVFGTRSFESSRQSIERILRTQRIRGGQLPPENEWNWPQSHEPVSMTTRGENTQMPANAEP